MAATPTESTRLAVAARDQRAQRLVVGIDLGTSHCAAAWARTPVAEAVGAPRSVELQQVQIVQAGAGGRKCQQPLLPSALYFPRREERSSGSEGWVVGRWAQTRAEETRGRSVLSAKSWLSHAGVDRLRPLLPFGSQRAQDVPAISPVQASIELLRSVRESVLEALPGEASDALWVLTVPASFDESARQLTLQAASDAGLEVCLLEEPQAAFYELLPAAESQLSALCETHGTVRILVCDLGGGTSDFTFLLAERGDKGLSVRRTAVGNHLLLGGDNMDLALAARVEARLSGRLSFSERGQLVLACRRAKETLLAPGAPEAIPVRLVSQGSRLLGELRQVSLARQEVEALVLDGFFPKVGLGETPSIRGAGLRSLGLPYERDPAITRHLARFVGVHSPGRMPHAVLFNGGVTAASSVRARLLDVLGAWEGAAAPVCLVGGDPALSVSRGAVRYGLAMQGHGLRVGSGAPAAFYIAVAGGSQPQGLCILPKGSPPGELHSIPRSLQLRVGGEVRFDAYRSVGRADAAGELVPLAGEGFEALPSLRADLSGVAPAQGNTLAVVIRGRLDPRGAVQITLQPAQTTASARAITLAFELRAVPAPLDDPKEAIFGASGRDLPPTRRGRSGAPSSAGVLPTAFRNSIDDLELVFGKRGQEATPRQVKDLVRTLEKRLGVRKSWSVEACRALSDELLSRSSGRLGSAEHDRVYWMLLGYALRPGFGWSRDPQRLDRAFAFFPANSKLRTTSRHWQAYWVAWRRLAAGLNAANQTAVFARIAPLLAPASEKLKKPKGHALQVSEEVWRLAAHLERLPSQERARLGGWILERSWTDRDPILWAHLGRIGARVSLYAGPDGVLEPFVVERWIEQLLGERWAEVPTAVGCAIQLCRKVGDPRRDVDPRLRTEVLRALEAAGADEAGVAAVREGAVPNDSGNGAGFEESLPLGLQL